MLMSYYALLYATNSPLPTGTRLVTKLLQPLINLMNSAISDLCEIALSQTNTPPVRSAEIIFFE